MALCHATTVSIARIGSGGRTTLRRPVLSRTHLILGYCRNPSRHDLRCWWTLTHPAMSETRCEYGVTDETEIGAVADSNFLEGSRC